MTLQDVKEELIRRCQAGDENAFSELYGLISPHLFAWIFSLTRDHDAAEEVFQECVIRVFKHLRKLREPKTFSRWLYQMAVRQCNTYWVRQRPHRYLPFDEAISTEEREVLFLETNPQNPRQVLLQKETMERLNEAIQKLPPRQRTALVLHEVEGYTVKEIAEMLGCSEGAVKFNLHHARKKVRGLFRAATEEQEGVNELQRE